MVELQIDKDYLTMKLKVVEAPAPKDECANVIATQQSSMTTSLLAGGEFQAFDVNGDGWSL